MIMTDQNEWGVEGFACQLAFPFDISSNYS